MSVLRVEIWWRIGYPAFNDELLLPREKEQKLVACVVRQYYT